VEFPVPTITEGLTMARSYESKHVAVNKTDKNYSFKYNQDATLYNILYYCQCSTCFGRFLHPSSGAQELCTYQMLCVQFLSSWWWAEKPPESCTALAVIKNTV